VCAGVYKSAASAGFGMVKAMRTVARTLRTQNSRKRSAVPEDGQTVGDDGTKVEVSAWSTSIPAGTIRPPRLPMSANFSHAMHGSLE
jgi:hypothetical protein